MVKTSLTLRRKKHTMKINPLVIALACCVPLAGVALPAAPAHAQKSAAAPFIAEAKKLLPTIGLDLNPGDGGPDKGSLTYGVLLPTWVQLARAQKLAGDTAGANASFAHGIALCTRKEGTYQTLTGVMLREGLRGGFADEAIAFSLQHNTDGYRAPFIAAYQAGERKDSKAAEATLLAGVEKSKALAADADSEDTLRTLLFRILRVARQYKLTAATTAAQTALAPFVPKMDGFDQCEAVYYGVPGVSATEAEAHLRTFAAERKDNGMLAVGLWLLGKPAEARAALAQIGPGGGVPPDAVLYLPLPDYRAVATRSKNPDTVIVAMRYLRQEQLDTPALLFTLNDLLQTIGPGKTYDDTLPLVAAAALAVPLTQTRTPASRSHVALLEKVYANDQAEYRAHPDPDEASSREGATAYLLAAIAPFDPAFVKTHLPAITEPRCRVVVLTALALAYLR